MDNIAGCNPEDPPGDGDTTIECLTEDCLGLILDMVNNFSQYID